MIKQRLDHSMKPVEQQTHTCFFCANNLLVSSNPEEGREEIRAHMSVCSALLNPVPPRVRKRN